MARYSNFCTFEIASLVNVPPDIIFKEIWYVLGLVCMYVYVWLKMTSKNKRNRSSGRMALRIKYLYRTRQLFFQLIFFRIKCLH